MRKGEQLPRAAQDGLWGQIEPLQPVVPAGLTTPGRKRLENCKVLSSILFVLYTGIPWEFLPQELVRDEPQAGQAEAAEDPTGG